jgi:nucleoid-associated protein YgaU
LAWLDEARIFMPYAVVHGFDRDIDRPQSACETLELVKLLEAQAEPDIRILDSDGAEIGLGVLEKRQREEVERKYVAAAAYIQPSSGARATPLPPAAGAANRRPIATLATLAVAVLSVGALAWRYEYLRARQTIPSGSHATRPIVEATPISPPAMKSSEATGNPAKRAEKTEVLGTRRPAQQAVSYTVIAGDTFRSIARKIYHDASRWRDISAANPLLDPRQLRPGEEINLPSQGSHGRNPLPDEAAAKRRQRDGVALPRL